MLNSFSSSVYLVFKRKKGPFDTFIYKVVEKYHFLERIKLGERVTYEIGCQEYSHLL